MRLIYTKPKLKDLSQGSRIDFIRQFRLMTQDDVSDRLGLTGECKRRTMTRCEKGGRNPKKERTKEVSEILNVDVTAKLWRKLYLYILLLMIKHSMNLK